ncbi:hypothetical protein QQS21_000872 [Conoideocrella luteorostrata]|uniref:Tat pathway signal sequence n=1 Tax=Conoideocrella luteorostrata TaxID=1105319 RepID=A0AAJ0G2A6_9HYPO|nr:hypothetical protein QQS21_000872 [Conoideocrella luteorostrata]
MCQDEAEIKEGCQSLLAEDEGPKTLLSLRKIRNERLEWLFRFVAVVSTTLLLITICFWVYLSQRAPEEQICYEKKYSLDSLWDAVRYEPVQFHLEPDIHSPFRGQPRPELDEAWANVTEGHLILLSKEEMRSLGHATEGAATHGNSYLALVEVFHHIHCIDFIRKYIFKEHYPNWRNLGGPHEAVLGHVDHCIDLIRQKVLCDADVGVMAYSYDPKTRLAKARTSNMHMCRNFGAIKNWAAERKWQPDLD